MDRRSTGVFRAVHDMIGSRMRGQLRLGDTIGVWTYNEKLYTGQLPLQDWAEGDRATIDDKILNFLGKQKFEKQGRIDAVLPALLQVVKNSEFITIILVTEGTQDFHGTPFDEKINQSYKAWNPQQHDARMPFLTVLRARHGEFTDCTVTSAPWPVDLPPLPSDLLKPKAPASLPPIVSTPKPAPPPPMAAPLIISGKKPQPSPIVVTGTNNSTTPQASAPAIESNAASQASQRIAEAPPASKIAAPGTNAISPPVAPSALAITPPVLPSASLETTRNNQLPADNLKGQGPASDKNQPSATANPAEAKKPDGTSTVQANTALESSRSAKDSVQAAPPPDSTRPQSQSATRPRPELAVASEAPIPTATKVIAWVLLGACCAAGLAFWMWRRRARPAGHVSLITRSLDRERD